MSEIYTGIENIFVPERLSEVIFDYAKANLALFGSDAVREMQAVNWSNGGNTVTFPVFKGVQGSLGALDCTSAASAPDVVEVEMDYETKNVVGKIIDVGMKGCSLEDAFKASNFGLVDAVLTEVSYKVKTAIDQALVAEAVTTTLEVDRTGLSVKTLNRSAVIAAKAKWQDQMNQPAVLVVSAKQYADILDEVKDYTTIGQSTSTTGSLPVVFGMPVIVSNNIAVADSKYTALLVGLGGISFAFARELTYKPLPQPGDKTIHEFTVRWIAKLMRDGGLEKAVKLITN